MPYIDSFSDSDHPFIDWGHSQGLSQQVFANAFAAHLYSYNEAKQVFKSWNMPQVISEAEQLPSGCV